MGPSATIAGHTNTAFAERLKAPQSPSISRVAMRTPDVSTSSRNTVPTGAVGEADRGAVQRAQPRRELRPDDGGGGIVRRGRRAARYQVVIARQGDIRQRRQALERDDVASADPAGEDRHVAGDEPYLVRDHLPVESLETRSRLIVPGIGHQLIPLELGRVAAQIVEEAGVGRRPVEACDGLGNEDRSGVSDLGRDQSMEGSTLTRRPRIGTVPAIGHSNRTRRSTARVRVKG